MTKFYHIKPRFFVVIVLSVLFVEIAGFIFVGNEIGILATLSLTLLTMIMGSILLRIQGISLFKNIQRKLIQGNMPEDYIADNVLIIIGAILLIFPGFISDILGISLLIKPIRTFTRFLFLSLHNKINAKTCANTQNASEKIIELNAEDYQSYNIKESPWYKNDDH
ncbi:FxsA family protein [Bartonella bovis]|uniref:FxsA family protein n=1 Tax=Bartonella bovis TaxID=155194 RepID=UPI000C9AD18E|nr:FxsA family protein [Bartonella bovis]